MASAARRRALRVLGWTMALTLIVPVLVSVAWLASNWNDVPAQPPPAALVLAPQRLDDASNRFWALAGVRSAPGTDGARDARAEWQRLQGWALLTHAERQRGVERWAADSQRTPPPRWLRAPSGPPWVCAADGGDCTAEWIEQAASLARQRQLATWGAKCQALLDGPFELEEPVGRPIRPASPTAPWTGAVGCMTWFLSGAVLAHTQGDRAALLADMARADRLHRAMAQGAHSLLAHTLAMRMAGRTADTSVHLALLDPTLAEPLAPLLEGWLPSGARIGRWVAHEANVQRGAIDDLLIGCVQPSEVRVELPESISWPLRLNEGVNRWMCQRRIGLQPELTAQANERNWLALLARVQADWPAMVAQAAPELPAWTWRNTTGSVLAAVASPAYDSFLQLHADFELHQRTAALVLALQRDGVAAGDRAVWLARQPLAPHERERITVQDGGRTIAARTWSAGTARRNVPRYTWPN